MKKCHFGAIARLSVFFALFAAICMPLAAQDESYDEYSDEYYDDYSDEYYDDEYYDDEYYDEDYAEEDPIFEIIRTGELSDIKAALGERTDSYGNTLLITACEAGRAKDVITWLLGNGSVVSARNYSGQTAFMLACQYADKNVVSLLVERGASISDVDDSGVTPLMFAAMSDDESVFQFLLGKGANAKAVSEYKNTVLHYLCMNASPFAAKVVPSLVKLGLDVNALDMDGRTPLLNAASYGDNALVEILIKSGAKVALVNEDGVTPLMYACSYNGDPALIKLLLRSGSAINAVDDSGFNALMYSFYGENPTELVSLLVKEGADVKFRSYDGRTSLHLAASCGLTNLFASLLSAGLSINEIDDQGMTPLMYACQNSESVEAVRMLLSKGADVTPVDESGYTAYDYACENSYLYEDESLLNALTETVKAI